METIIKVTQREWDLWFRGKVKGSNRKRKKFYKMYKNVLISKTNNEQKIRKQ